MLVFTVVYNKPSFLTYQVECLRRYLQGEFTFCVFDNSDSAEYETQFRNLCADLNVTHVRVPPGIHTAHDPSIRAGKSLDYALRYVYSTLNYRGVVMVNDSDLFLVKPFDPLQELEGAQFVGRGQYRDGGITYYTNQFLILDYATLPNVQDITFVPGVVDDKFLDCGGLLSLYFRANPEVVHRTVADIYSNKLSRETMDKCPEEIRPYIEREIQLIPQDVPQLDIRAGHAFSEYVANAFIHLRAGSNWIGHNAALHWNREYWLYRFLCEKLIDWGSVIQPSDTNKYVVSFSLYGNNPKYIYNAIMNAILVNIVYAGWISRFYCDDTVPPNILAALRSIPHTEIVMMQSPRTPAGSERMLWRFYAASDPTVAAMISRDCDSWVSFREAFSVKAWIQSDKAFHILRDHCYHSQKIMGGMWGVKRGTLPDMESMCIEFMKAGTYDQGFLATTIYPQVVGSAMVHLGNQFNNQRQPANGYFPDGGVLLATYPRIREYIPTIDIEALNSANAFHCSHCGRTHEFFIGEMFNTIIQPVVYFLYTHFPMLRG